MKKENAKIKNATIKEYNGIKFKSRLEVCVYKTLKEHNFNVLYEPIKYTIWSGFKPIVPFYTKDNKTGLLKLDSKKMIDITYTPDFIVRYKDTIIVIEVKGFENDVFPYKKKLFRAYLDTVYKTLNQKLLFFEIFSKRQLLQAIEIIKSYENTSTKNQ